jgi:hypothetical protein
LDWQSLTGSKSTPGAIARWINNSTLSSGSGGDADSILQEAQDWIYRRLRHWQMLSSPLVGSFTVGSDTISEPADFLEPKLFCITGVNAQMLTLKTPDDIVRAWAYDDQGNRVQQQPMIYYFDNANFRFDSPADQFYPYALIYFQQPATLSASNLTNFLTSNAQMLLRRSVMRAACEWSKEVASGQYDRTYWEQACEDELHAVQEESDRSVHSIVIGPQFIGGGGMGPNWGLWG